MTETTTAPAPDGIDEFDFSGSQGAEAAREAFKNSQVSFDKTDFFGLDGSPAAVAAGTNSAIIRMLSDHVAVPGVVPWISVTQHSMVPTKPKPADHEGSWPKSMGAICRNDKIFKAKYGDCYIDTMPPEPGKKNRNPSSRTWALAVLREEVLGSKEMVAAGQIPESMLGQVVGIRDKTKEVAEVDKDGKPTGETKVVKQYVKVNQGWKNFFAPLAGIAGRNKTVLDRDIYISREGEGANDTVYTPMPLDPIVFPEGHKFAGKVFDLRDAEQRAEFYPDAPDLRKLVAEQASNEYFNRFFVPNDRLYGNGEGVTDRKPAAAKTATGAPAGPASTPAAPSTEQAAPAADRLAALKARVGGGAAPAAAPEAPTAAPAEPVAEAAPSEAAPAADAPAEAAAAPAGGGLAL